MSKAFTRESDEPEEVPLFRPQLPPGTRNYITPQGAESLKVQLSSLLAKKQGLLADSSAGELRKVEAAIRNLQLTLSSVVVANPPADRQKVAFGATVTVRHESGEKESFRIVGIEETQPEQGAISWLSPLGRALMSRRVGDMVQFRSPNGLESLEVLTVAYFD